MFLKQVKLGVSGSKLFSTNNIKCATAVNVTKKDEIYNKLDANTSNSASAGWDKALPFEDIPGPKPLPLIGNMWMFLPFGPFYKVPLEDAYKSLRAKYGDIVSLRIPFRDPMVIIFQPKDIEFCLRNEGPRPVRKGAEGLCYYRRHLRKDIYKGNVGILSTDGEEWYNFRTIVNPILMQPRSVMQYVGSMDLVANQLVANMKHFSENNENNEMSENFISELHKWGLESMGVIALDKHLGCLDLNLPKDSEPQKLIAHVLEMFDLMYTIEVLPPLWKYFNTPSFKRFVEVMDFITGTSYKYIEEAMAKTVDENTPDHELSMLRRLAKVDKYVAVTMAVDMLGAGIDTTGRVMGAALYYIARNPDKQERLREELLKNLPEKDSPVTKEVLSNSPYLKAVIKETTRLAPIALGNFRTSVKDLVLGGYKIPKDTDLIAMQLFLSQSDEQYKDNQKFIPERWLRTTQDEYSYKNAHPFSTMPFGFGARSCVGKRLANLEMEVAMAKIIRNFKLSWHHKDMEFTSKLLYGLNEPLRLTVKSL